MRSCKRINIFTKYVLAQSALDAAKYSGQVLELSLIRMEAHLDISLCQALELSLNRMEANLDILIWIRQPMERLNVAAQAPTSSRETDPDKS